ncbi:Pkh1p [Rhizophagus irregularis DAOM 197198w]|uniref:Pkh1p n=1 Tax=Rhizophagus irregularis (strain DAOM 197198w) TaxID=1432141 RepID=A0A015K1B2_RHIIW|nr:Pkh1p [Rhizophagus irregularis DAOM 197198w]
METQFSKLNISNENSNKDSNLESISQKNCSYCNKPFTEELWCKECDPFRMIEGWTSENNDIDKFIRDTIYDSRMSSFYNFKIIEWVPFDRFEDVKQIGEGGFAKVYSATWIDGKTEYNRQDDGSWKKQESRSMEVALKRLNGSQNMSAEYLNELKIHWKFIDNTDGLSLRFYGITKDPETEEFMMILDVAQYGNLRSFLSSNFNKILWKDKINYLFWIISNLDDLHGLGYSHKDFHSGNILRFDLYTTYISDFGLSGPLNKQKSDDKICGVLPYIAPEVLNKEPYSLSSDIYSFGVIMAELSSGKPPFSERKHDISLALEICNGLRPEFGKGTPEIYKKLAYKCMNANSNQRQTAKELYNIIAFWRNSFYEEEEKEEFGYKRKEIKAMFEEADKEIPNISTSHKKNSGAIYTSRLFSFNNLTKPVNSSIITSYLDDDDEGIV